MRLWLVCLAVTGCAAVDQGVEPTRLTVTFENSSDESTFLLSTSEPLEVVLAPGLYAVSTDPGALLAVGVTASAGLERLAETGDASALLDEVLATSGVMEAGLFGDQDNPTYADNPLTPGGSASFTVDVVAGASLVMWMMLGASNDTFLGTEGGGISLDELEGADVVARLTWWDAGTEVNEPLGEGVSQPAAAPGTDAGTSEGGVVHVAAGGEGELPAVVDVVTVGVRRL